MKIIIKKTGSTDYILHALHIDAARCWTYNEIKTCVRFTHQCQTKFEMPSLFAT